MTKGIILENVSFGYQKNQTILKNISLEIQPGDFLGITGINGSGKSTLTYLFNGLIPHFFKGHLNGKILIDGISTKTQSITYFSKKVGMVFQNPDFSLFNLTVEEEIAFGLKNFHLDCVKKRIEQALEMVGLGSYIDRDPQTLSFGEKQKVCLACVLALDTDYIVLDEPTSMLDYKSSLELYKILQKLNNQQKTIIVVEHDSDFLWQFSKKVLILSKGKIESSGKTEALLSNTKLLQRLGIKVPNIDIKTLKSC